MSDINENQKPWTRTPSDEEWARIWDGYGEGSGSMRRNKQTRNHHESPAAPLAEVLDCELDTEDPPASESINLPMPTGTAETRQRKAKH